MTQDCESFTTEHINITLCEQDVLNGPNVFQDVLYDVNTERHTPYGLFKDTDLFLGFFEVPDFGTIILVFLVVRIVICSIHYF
jgi:hypothetical protein